MAVYIDVRTLVERKFRNEDRRVNVLEISRETGITRPTIERWLHEPHKLTKLELVTLDAWLKYLGCKVDDVIHYEHAETPQNGLVARNRGHEEGNRDE